ncbi:MAG: MMPL family transporter [Tahibacter sp.]
MSRTARAGALLAWLGALALLLWYVTANLEVGTDLRSFMPPPSTAEQRLLLDEIGEGPGSRLLLLAIRGDEPDTLAGISQRLAAALRGDAQFLRVLNGESDLSAIGAELLPYRYLLSPTLDTQRFDAESLRGELIQRVEDLGSPAAAWLKPLLPRDPTLETLKLAESWAPAKEPARYADVWFDAKTTYALLLIETRAPGFDPQAQRAALDALQRNFTQAAAGSPAQLEVSGPGAFTVSVSETTSAEANRIGMLDSIGFMALLLFAYRRVSTVLLGALPLVSGGLAGTAALALLFGGAHGITLAFGFTLIGVAQDYPIHLFSHLRPASSPVAVARHLWPTLVTGIASTGIAYLAFFASGVTGLEQLAVFTVVGLATAGATTRYALAPLLSGEQRDAALSRPIARLWRRLERLPRPGWLAPLLAVLALAVIGFGPGAFWENNLAALTPVPAPLLERDAALRAELGAPDVRYLLVIEAPDPQGVLRASEQLDPQLAALRERGALGGYELPSRWLPSLETQRARQVRLPDDSSLRAMLQTAQSGLPFKADTFAPFLEEVAAARALTPLTVEAFSDGPLGLRLKAMLLAREGHAIGLVGLVGVNDTAALVELAAHAATPAYLLDLKHASETLVAAYRVRVLWSLSVASLLLIGVVWIALRRRERVLRVLVPMAVTTLLILAVLRGCGISLSLFHLIALILAAGLGLDYALFFEQVEEDEMEQRRTLHAVLVCSVSTFLVFALLAASSLPVLRAIGTTVTLGVLFNFVLALLIARKPSAVADGVHRHAG